MNGIDDPHIEAAAFTPPAFPTWPPPSGGAPNTTWEQGPILNPIPYGSPQTSNINNAPPDPPFNAMKYPQRYALGSNGQNQGASNALPPMTRPWEVGPILAPPSISAGNPPYIMGPSSSAPHLSASQTGKLGPVARTFPAGSYIDGYGNLVTPTGVVRTIGGLGN